MIERTVPARDKANEAKAAARANRAKNQRQRAAALKKSKRDAAEEQFNLPGFDYRKEAEALWKLFCKRNPTLNKRTPEVVLIGPFHNSYGDRYNRQVRISQSPSRHGAFMTLVHELAHVAEKRDSHGSPHGANFYQAMKEVIQMRLKMTISFADVITVKGYKMDAVIGRQVAAWEDEVEAWEAACA
jgi:hypothetical protein